MFEDMLCWVVLKCCFVVQKGGTRENSKMVMKCLAAAPWRQNVLPSYVRASVLAGSVGCENVV
jgi:hypothetical protein